MGNADPFSPAEPSPLTAEPFRMSDGTTLALSKKLLLSITPNELHIHDDKTNKSKLRSCCGLWAAAAKPLIIPLYNVLYAEVGESTLTIKFATKVSRTTVKPSSLSYPYEPAHHTVIEEWSTRLLNAAYGESQVRKRFKVIINPFGGRGSAATIFDKSCRPLLYAANCSLDVQITEHSGHAIEIAENLDIDAFDAILCCSGDGVPHEVFNGLAKRPDGMRALKTMAVCQLPGGSGNGMCWNLTGTGDASAATLSIIKSIRKPLDLISITQGDNRLLSFLSQSFGIIAELDLGTEDLRWMGSARFTYGLLQRVWKRTVYPCDIAVKVAIDSKDSIREHYRQRGSKEDAIEYDYHKGLPELKYGDINSELPEDWQLVHRPNMGNFYAGNMAWMSAGVNFFPASLPNDGMFDLICVDATVSRFQIMKMLLLVETGKHFDLPHVSYRKVLSYRIIPHKRPGVEKEYISVDGEQIPFGPFQAEVHHGLGTVLAKGHVYEAPGV